MSLLLARTELDTIGAKMYMLIVQEYFGSKLSEDGDETLISKISYFSPRAILNDYCSTRFSTQ